MSWWSLGRIGGVPVRLHWSAIVGALFFSGFRLAPGAWLGFVLVILVHELGHAAVVKATRMRVHGVSVHGLGGECQWSGNATPLQRAAIAWGGVWGQLALVAIVLPLAGLLAATMGAFGADLAYALTWGSLMLAALNLIPYGPLDGVEAWKLPRLLLERWRRLRSAGQRASSPTKRSSKEEISPEVRAVMERIAREARDARRRSS